jgi:hypothetical protein
MSGISISVRQKGRGKAAVALVMVLVFIAVGLTALAGVMAWSSLVSTNSDRYANYVGGIAVTDALLEKATGKMIRDFQANDRAYIASHISEYQTLVPTPSENPAMTGFQFSNLARHVNEITIDTTADWAFGDLATKFDGLRGYSVTYRLSGCATDLTARKPVPVTVQEQLQLASIPLFCFGVFYNLDLEACPSGAFTVHGRTHSNGNIYTEPAGSLSFATHVTASAEIVPHKSPDDPSTRTIGPVVFNGDTEQKVTSFILPMGTNSNPSVLHKILEVPPVGESSTSLIGKQRYYNKADLIIRITTNGVMATSGSYNGFSVAIADLDTSGIISTNAGFFDKREYMHINSTDIDIAQLLINYSALNTALGRNPQTLYIADDRPFPTSYIPGVRVKNGSTLPAAGLTIATHHPLYLLGNYNVPSGYAGTTNTALCAPASLVCDGITVLSAGWIDANSGGSLSVRVASASVTINAAVITGIVPSGNGYYSGGLENVFRLLENWGGKTVTYNGSIAVLYDSHEAVGPWISGSDIYSPPTRTFSWDTKFQQENSWPPAMPFISAAFRSKWNSLAAP